VRRLPITIRLTLVFAAVTAVVLAGTGLFLYVRLAAELELAVEEGLRSRADDVAAFVQRSGPVSSQVADRRLTEADESFAQIVDAQGKVVGGSPGVGHRPLLAANELEEARRQTFMPKRRFLAVLDDDPVQLLATPVDAGGERLVVIVGTSVGDLEETLGTLAAQLLTGGSVALLLATLTALGVARAALRPVDSMRSQADAISGVEPGRRLTLPPTRDELRRLGETLNAMLARLEAALAHERTFVADASHELRTPLAILKLELELALRHDRSRGELQEAVRAAAEETDRLVRIAEDLLVIARSEQRRLPMRLVPNDVGELFAMLLQRFGRRAEMLGYALEADAPDGLTVRGDRLALEQALENMVDNALNHGHGPIRLVAVQRLGNVELHVLDEGTGFAPGFLVRAFERFSREDDSRGSRGTGLGLAVVESIAVAHGGRAHATNRPTGGADVWVSLPGERARPGAERGRYGRPRASVTRR
jgi:signal transduction histidine kinase